MPAYQDAFETMESEMARHGNDRQSLAKRELEVHLVEQCRRALDANAAWDLSYESVEAYEASCEPHRERWSRTIGEITFDAPLNPRYEPFFETDTAVARWVYVDLDEGLTGRAVLALPKEPRGKLPLVLAQHGIGSTPERVFGIGDAEAYYHAYGLSLLDAGYAVLAPSNIRMGDPRRRLQRLCLLQGTTLAGVEVGALRRMLTFASELPEVDENRIAMWGISLGGMYTMFTAPLEKRIKVAINTAFFNDRFAKMAVSSPLYSCFLDVNEEHIWIPGWLREFTDSDLASLICPRPLLVEQGKADGIAWWPMMLEEYEATCEHYRKLGFADRIEIDLHEGGHEIRMERSLDFLKKWLAP